MWTIERPRYGSNTLRYPSDMTDTEWTPIARPTSSANRGDNTRKVNMQQVVNGLRSIRSATGSVSGVRPRRAHRPAARCPAI